MGIHGLPAELLLIIFKFAATTPPRKGDKVSVCITLSHVCKKWRRLAISCQAFWALIPRRTTQWTNICLSRCLSTPLSLNIEAPCAAESDYHHAARLTFPHFMRAKHLRLVLDDRTDAAAPLLQDISAALSAYPLSIVDDVNVVFRGRAPLDPHGPSQQPLLPATLFPSTVRSVYIDNCALLDTPTMFSSGIRRIEFVNIKPWPTVHIMAQFFRAIPQLEYFAYRLTEAGHDMHIDWKVPLPEFRGVDLNHLRGLFLEGPINQNYVVFSCLSLPSNTALIMRNSKARRSRSAFSTFPHDPPREQFQALVARSSSALQSHFADAVPRGAHYDAVRFEGDTISAARDKHSSADQSWRYVAILPAPGDICLEAPVKMILSDAELHRRSLEAVATLPIFTLARTIEFGNDFHWQDMLTAMVAPSAVQVVQLESLTAVDRFTHQLQKVEPKDIFPKLECVRLLGIIFNERDIDLLSLGQGLVPTMRLIYAKNSRIRLELRRCVMSQANRQLLEARMDPWLVDYDEYTAPPPESNPRLPLGIELALRKLGGRKKHKELPSSTFGR